MSTAGEFRYTDRVQKLRVDAASLERALRDSIEGEVRFDAQSRALYATDASNYRQVPIGVVVPRSEEDVIETVRLAREFGAPILSRGGGTSLAGQCCNVAVVLDFSKYLNDVIELNAREKYAWVHPGIILDSLRDEAEKHKLTFGPDPATHDHCTIGGMIGNNSCGVHALMAGKTVDNILELDVLLYDGTRLRAGGKLEDSELEAIVREGDRRGEIYGRLRDLRDKYGDQVRHRYPKIPRRVSGYNIDSLLPEYGFNVAQALVGSESTCAVVLRAKCRLVYSPPVRTLLVLGFRDIYTAADHVPEVLESRPIGLEGIDDRLVNDMKRKGLHPEDLPLLPEGSGWLLVEFGGESKEEADGKARELMERTKHFEQVPSMKLYDDPKQEKNVWTIRESGLGATANVPGQPLTWEGWEDSAVAPENLGKYLRDFRALLDRYGYGCDLYGHFGQGCVHTRIDFGLDTAAGITAYRSFLNEAADLVVRYGGSLSGEHGDGQSRADLLPKMFGEELIEAFREFKAIWDPDWKMNPGKIVRPYHIDENLRLGATYSPWQPETHFEFPDDNGSFARATLRCVGVGECRRIDHGTMCPSFMATREEEHTTRGRAHLLFEMFKGDVIPSSWDNDAVADALDLCLACKGCKGECPVNVDMATYKAEFLSHYYEHNARPRTAYTMGWIRRWATLASFAPGVANFFTSTEPFATLAKAIGGIAKERRIPKFASGTFSESWAPRKRNAAAQRVILWPDTFNDHFHPQTARAAARVLERAGYDVALPPRGLCCGRPLYDYGFLDLAKKQLIEILDALEEDIAAEVALVVLEPSCLSVFRDELVNMLPRDPRAKRLAKNSVLLTELILRNRDRFDFHPLNRNALLHGHCHQKSLFKMTSDEEVLKMLGIQFEAPDSGCCGMAGAFGFEKKHYEISQQLGNRALLPAVGDARRETLIIASGFSCREQIAQNSDRRALHIAEVLDAAAEAAEPLEDLERNYRDRPANASTAVMVAGAAVALFAGVALLRRSRVRRRRR